MSNSMIDRSSGDTPRSMNCLRRETVASVLLALSSVVGGCGLLSIDCYDNECVGGLEWTATTADEMALRPGPYELRLDLEGDELTVACTVADDGTGSCGEPIQTTGDRDFRVRVVWFGEMTATVDGMGSMVTRHGIAIIANEHVEGGTRGPTDVSLALYHEGAVVIEESYALDYERDETYHGDERCGFCDSTETRSSTFTQ